MKSHQDILCIIVSIVLTLIPSSVFAQSKTATISGKVSDPEGKPMDFASVVVLPSNQYVVTDAKGLYTISNIAPGEVTVKIEFFGMEPFEKVITLKAGEKKTLDVVMTETSFRLENVVVTATRSDAGKSTASTISRQAMDHMQTSSLADIMSLLPGGSISNPTLSSARSLSVRNNGGTSMGSLGTAVLVDGAPISNNSNMMTLSTAQSGSMASGTGAGSAATGSDIRSLSTDNVESVEVIRGIPSVEYGDLTSGAVLVKSKAGRSPLTVRLKTNPNIYQVSAAKGFGLGKKAGDLNVSGDYAYNRNELIHDFESYQRGSMKALWSVMKGVVTENTSVTASYSLDRRLPSTDGGGVTQSSSKTMGIQFNTNGRASINGDWLKSINWLVSGSFNDKNAYYEDRASNAMNLYSTSMTNGAVYTQTVGQKVIDSVTGKEITNAAGASDKGVILPYSYMYSYNIYGKEVNSFSKLNANFAHTWGSFTDRLLVGADFKTDGNLGRGAVYDDDYPPFRNVSNAASGYRRRAYSDIPFVNQAGAYLENEMSYKLGERDFYLTTGVRYDNVNGHSSLAPRINGSVEVFPWLALRAGYGITSKAPTTLYLNPNYAYQDVVNFNSMDAKDPAQRLLIATTNIYDAKNYDLQIARNHKAEVGFDLTIAKRYNLSVTAYEERMNNGYSMGLTMDSFVWYQFDLYKRSMANETDPITVTKDVTRNMFFTVYRPTNNVMSLSRGIEYELDLGRFKAIRTSFHLSGAWTYGQTQSAGYSFSTRTNSLAPESHIGVYAPGKEVDKSERMVTTLRATHNIPQIGFVVTVTGQLYSLGRAWTSYHNDDMLCGYISYHDGQYHDFDPSKKNDPEFSYLFPTLSDSRFIVEKYTPYALFNINISKEIGDLLTASFYANNFLNTKILDRSESSGTMIKRGIPLFFGFELKVNIK